MTTRRTLALILLAVVLVPGSVRSETLGGAVLEGSVGTFAIGCSVKSSGTSCTGNFSMLTGLEFSYPCSAALVSTQPGDTQAGACSMRSTGAQASVSATGCDAFVVTKEAHGGSVTFTGPLGEAWDVTTLVIKAVDLVHSPLGDTWTLVPFGVSEPDGSRIVATNGTRTMTLIPDGTVEATSDCTGGINASNFNVDLSGAWTIA